MSVAISTVLHTYQILEDRGLIEAAEDLSRPDPANVGRRGHELPPRHACHESQRRPSARGGIAGKRPCPRTSCDFGSADDPPRPSRVHPPRPPLAAGLWP